MYNCYEVGIFMGVIYVDKMTNCKTKYVKFTSQNSFNNIDFILGIFK